MKKFWVLLTIMSMTIGLIACSNKDPAPTPTTAPPVTQPIETTTAPKEPELTEPTVPPYDGILKPYTNEFNPNGIYRSNITLLKDNIVRVELYGVEYYRATDVTSAKVGDKIIINGYETEIKEIERITPNKPTSRVIINKNSEFDSVELIQEINYDYSVDIQEGENYPFTMGDYYLFGTNDEASYAQIHMLDVELTPEIKFTDNSQFNEDTGKLIFDELTGLELLDRIRKYPDMFTIYNSQTTVNDGKIIAFNLFYHP